MSAHDMWLEPDDEEDEIPEEDWDPLDDDPEGDEEAACTRADEREQMLDRVRPMSARVEWTNEMAGTYPKVTGRLPKRAVHWIGEIWLLLPSGEKDIRAFRSNNPMTTGHVQVVLGQLLDRLIGEHGKDSAVSSGFWCKSR